jgi:tetratricopeptide (TPR) repeat protein
MAAADYSRALARQPDHVESLMGRAWTRILMRQPDKALEDYQKAAKLLPPSDVRHHRSLGFGYLRANQCDKALPFLERALAMAPKEAQHHAWVAECLARLDRLPEALAGIDRAIALFRDPVYYGIRAAIHRRMGRLDAVAEDYRQIVALDRNATSLNNLCWARAMWGRQLKEALADCDEALAQFPEAASFLDSRGFVHFRLGDFRAAIADYDKAIRLRPKSPHSLYIRGLAKKALGEIADGNDDVRAARAITPEIEKEFAPAGIVP